MRLTAQKAHPEPWGGACAGVAPFGSIAQWRKLLPVFSAITHLPPFSGLWLFGIQQQTIWKLDIIGRAKSCAWEFRYILPHQLYIVFQIGYRSVVSE